MTRAERPQAASPTPATTTASQCLSLAGKTSDLVMELSIAMDAYLALELFVEPAYADEAQARVPPSRAQLTSMLHAINVEVQRKMATLADTLAVLQAQAAIDAAHAR